MRAHTPAMIASALLWSAAAPAQLFPPQTKDQRIQFATAQFEAAMAGRSAAGPGFCVDWGNRSVLTAAASPAELAKILTKLPDPPPSRYVFHSVWTATANNPAVVPREPFVITYSFIPDGVVIPGYNGEAPTPCNIHAVFNASFGSADAWKNHIRRGFNRWGELTGITYAEVADDGAPIDLPWPLPAGVTGARGDVRIGAHNVDGTNGILAYNFYPAFGSEMILDSSDVSFYNNPANNYRYFHFIVTHEHGHGMGLEHVTPIDQTKLMEPYINDQFDGPQQDDIRAGQQRYGDNSESNDSPAEAVGLGTLAPGAAPIIDRAIEATGQEDYYWFTLASPHEFHATLAPVGTTYATAENGTIHAAEIHDLAIDLLGVDGSTVIASGDANPAGANEAIAGVDLSGPGIYYLRVRSRGGANDVQRYRVDFSLIPPLPPPPYIESMVFDSSAAADGELRESGPGSDVGGTAANGNTAGLVGDTYSQTQRKLLLSFDTSALPDGAPLASARLRIRGSRLHGDPSGFGPIMADTASGFFGASAALEPDDFHADPDAAGVVVGVPPTDGSFHEVDLDAGALAAINPASTTQFRLAFAAATDGDSLTDAVQISMGEDVPAKRPQLVVDYVVVPTFTPTPTPTPTPVPTPTPCSPAANPPTNAVFRSTADDGEVRESSQFSAAGGVVNGTSSVIQMGDTSSKQQRVAILSFDTSSLPDNAIVLGATVGLTFTGKAGDPSVLGDLVLDLDAGAFGGDPALAPADFESSASAPNAATVPAASVPQSGYPVSLAVPVTGVAPCNVNAAGVTQVRVRFSVPDDGDGSSDVLYLSTAENRVQGAATLTVSYSIP